MQLCRLAKRRCRPHYLADLVIAVLVLDLDINGARGDLLHGVSDCLYRSDQRFGETDCDEDADYRANQPTECEPELANRALDQNIRDRRSGEIVSMRYYRTEMRGNRLEIPVSCSHHHCGHRGVGSADVHQIFGVANVL